MKSINMPFVEYTSNLLQNNLQTGTVSDDVC